MLNLNQKQFPGRRVLVQKSAVPKDPYIEVLAFSMVVLGEATLGAGGHGDEVFLVEPYNRNSNKFSYSVSTLYSLSHPPTFLPSLLCSGKQALTILDTDLW